LGAALGRAQLSPYVFETGGHVRTSSLLFAALETCSYPSADEQAESGGAPAGRS
jgi:hypothetical protein